LFIKNILSIYLLTSPTNHSLTNAIIWQNIPSMQSNINWLKSTFQYRNSVLPKVAIRVLFCGVFSGLIAYLHTIGYQVSVPILANIIPSVLIGLLLVFRTNTANDRFWEGRKLWGDINNSIRNLSRHIWIMHTNQEQIQDKKEILSNFYHLDCHF
jgi:ion channel-forming bestrophin family protein